MPCSDGAPNYYDDPETKHRLNLATRLLCSLCDRLLTAGKNDYILADIDLVKWWNNHQEEDRKREAVEASEREQKQATAKALAKLTPDERKLLGITRQ